jgi:hypothetical protein
MRNFMLMIAIPADFAATDCNRRIGLNQHALMSSGVGSVAVMDVAGLRG